MRIPGIINQSDLRDRMDRAEIRALQRRGEIRAVGTWYATSEAPSDVLALLALGFRPACVDAASLLGLWTPPIDGVHVCARRDSGALGASGRMASGRGGAVFRQVRRRIDPASGRIRPEPAGAAVGQALLHAPHLRAWPDREPVPPVDLVLEQAARCLSTVGAAIVLESALDRRVVGRAEMGAVLDRLPAARRGPLSRIRDDAQSGTETFVRWWLESRRFQVRSQVWIAEDHRADLLVGRSWIIECDSRAFHDDPAQYRRDRERDLRLRALGYTVTRLTWEQVFVTWEQTERSLLAILARGDHRRALPGR